MKNIIKVFCAAIAVLMFSACASMNNEKAAPERFSDLHFDNKAPIPLMVKNIDVKSEFTPSFVRPNVEHLFPVSIERTAKTWAKERLDAVDHNTNRVAEFIIKDASVTEEEVKAEQLLQKDGLHYHANLTVVLKVIDNKASAQTSVTGYRDLTIPVDTSIEDKEKYWNEMVINLFRAFDEKMNDSIHNYLNMYIKDDNSVTSF